MTVSLERDALGSHARSKIRTSLNLRTFCSIGVDRYLTAPQVATPAPVGNVFLADLVAMTRIAAHAGVRFPPEYGRFKAV
jgi:hypothetical protein